MTGELFAFLQSQSVLRHSIAADGWDALSRPEAMAAQLFCLRAKDLLEGAAPETARTRLSGLLIGAELAAAHPYLVGQQIAIIGSKSAATIADAPRMTLVGFTAAYRALKETA